jgi:hypothetical protein
VDKIFAVFEAVMIAAFAGVRVLTFAGDYARAINSYKVIQVCSAGAEAIGLWRLMSFLLQIWLRRQPNHSTYHARQSGGHLDTRWAEGDIVL